MATGFFATVAEAQRRAKKQLPKSVYMALVAGSESGLTVKDHVEAFGELGFALHVAALPGERDLATTVLGQEISLPVVIGSRRSTPKVAGGGRRCQDIAADGIGKWVGAAVEPRLVWSLP